MKYSLTFDEAYKQFKWHLSDNDSFNPCEKKRDITKPITNQAKAFWPPSDVLIGAKLYMQPALPH